MKRPWLMAAWPLLLLFYSSSTLTKIANCSKNKNNDARLKVSIRKDTMHGVPSCQHTFSQIELLNLHSTEPIMIHSIHTIPEETVLVRPDSGSPTSSPSFSPQQQIQTSRREPDYGRSWSGDDIPQQLHVSKLPSGSLSLGPGQVAIVPVTFLPRYPSRDCNGNSELDTDETDDDDSDIEDYYADTVSDGRSPPPLSSTAKLDLVDLVGEKILRVIDNKRQYLRHTLDPMHRRRNNLGSKSLPTENEQYEVSTTVVVDTSRGIVKLPITASSIRDNMYNIPDAITFHHPSLTIHDDTDVMVEDVDSDLDALDTGGISTKTKPTMSKSSTRVESGRRRSKQKSTGDNGTSSLDGIVLLDTLNASGQKSGERDIPASILDTVKPERECYDLYLSNPFPDRELQIMEALISRPEFVSVHFEPNKMAALDLKMLVGSGPSQVLRQWTLDGPLYLAPDAEDQYTLTVCTAFEGEIEPDEGSETYLDEMSKWIDAGDPERNLGFLQIRTDVETLFIGLEHAETLPYQSFDPVRKERSLINTLHKSNNTEDSQHSDMGTLLQSSVKSLDFEFTSTHSPPVLVTFGLRNKSPVPIRIMRVSVGIDSSGSEENAREADLIGLKIEIRVKKEYESEGQKIDDRNDSDHDDTDLRSLLLGAATSLDNILELTCSLSPDRYFSDSMKEIFHFHGNIIVRGTMDTDLTYHQWRAETLRNPYRDGHLTLEVPFTISILNGRVEALINRSSHPYPQLFAAQSWDGSGRAVSHLFFPMNQYTAVEGTEDILPRQTYVGANEIRHDLRILSNMVFPLDLVGADIVDNDPTKNQSLCDRFNVSVVPPSNSDDLYLGFEEIGFLVLKYRFATKGKKIERHQELLSADLDPYLPKKCSMVIKTKPAEAGEFKIPLLIFPGRLEISSKDSVSMESSTQNEVLIGFGKFLSWCRSSHLGKTFIKALSKISDDRRKSRSDSYLLSRHVMENSGWDPKSKPRYLPILLKVGAIMSDKILKTPLYLTNHNPIPITVSIDVGEIEGLSISLSRDESEAADSDNSLVDYLPKSSKNELIDLGSNIGHPIAGLIGFLTSSEQALRLMSKFSFRDAVSPHAPAMNRTDVLQLLHDWHSTATFHRQRASKRIGSNGVSKCNGKFRQPGRPPHYSASEIFSRRSDKEDISNAFIFSSDEQEALPLLECWRRDPNNMSSDVNTIKIPPGARARFEVQVRAPSTNFFRDDISHVLMSGLSLSTNLGDVMPIFVAFEALQGQLHGMKLERTYTQAETGNIVQSVYKKTVMDVPLHLSWRRSQDANEGYNNPVTIPPSPRDSGEVRNDTLADEVNGNGMPLFLKSSLSRDVRVRNVHSCNPWFQFVALDPKESLKELPDIGVMVGSIRTNVDCSRNASTVGGFPSFYQCLLNWISARSYLQPEGCGNTDALKWKQMDSVKRTIEMGLRRLQKSEKSLFAYDPDSFDPRLPIWNETELSHVKTGRRSNDGTIHDLASYEALSNALKIANNFRHDVLSTSLKATIEYDTRIDKESEVEVLKQNFTLPIAGFDVRSVLTAPKLFHGDQGYLRFEPTIVGSVVSEMISLRNPTEVPVRVRISTSPKKRSINKSHETRRNLGSGKLNTGVYVQNGKSSAPRNFTTSFSWWDGYGNFFIPNEYGDIIRSHNNISVTGGGGVTSVSLINPSLNAQVGFLVGCGKRCGVKEVRDKTSVDLSPSNPVSSSPIGAAAASGVILKGNSRSNSPDTKEKIPSNPILLAGSSSVATLDGPSAFAIPFSALDEIVIPPFGTGLLGPIYFRPPGRHQIVGCESAKQSGAKFTEHKSDVCRSQTFDSFLYLENSLTGIEKIGLRGQSMWDNLIFVDPPPNEGEDSYSDIELRDGMPTLFFSGTSNTVKDQKASIFGRTTQHLSVVKEVLLHNAGDVDSFIGSVSLTGMKSEIEEGGSCSFGSFRLLNCWESLLDTNEIHVSDTVNAYTGFVLKPGENRSLFVEHIPDCRTKKEFVSINVYLRKSEPKKEQVFRRLRKRGLKNPFGKSVVKMFAGYQMDGILHDRCVPVNSKLNLSFNHTDKTLMNKANYSSRIEGETFGSDIDGSLRLFLQFILFTMSALILCYTMRERFHTISSMLHKIQGEPTQSRRNWNAAFRCLARSHATSIELQTMSREQMRQDVIGRYKAKGNASSSSYSTKGFSRDRRSAIANTIRHRIGKEITSGSERTRPFSDALFHDTLIADQTSLRRHLPIGLGWRTAYSRGIIEDQSVLPTSFASRTKNLLNMRLASKTRGKLSEDENEGRKILEKDNPQLTNRDHEEPGLGASPELKNMQHNETVPLSLTVEPTENVVAISSEESTSSLESEVNGTKSLSTISATRSIGDRDINVTETKRSTEGVDGAVQNKPKLNSGLQSAVRDEITTSKTKNGNNGSHRIEKSKLEDVKSSDCSNSSKKEKSSKSVPRGQLEKPKVSAKSQAALLGPLPKSSASSNAWQGGKQKSHAAGTNEKKDRSEKKSKSSDNQKKKKESKVSAPMKKKDSEARAGRDVELDQSVPIATISNKPRSQPALTPPPGFGPPSVPVSPTINTKASQMPLAESQLSLDRVLSPTIPVGSIDTDMNPCAQSETSPPALSFPQATSVGSDIFFQNNLNETQPSPTMHKLPNPDGFSHENTSSLAPTVDEPWLPSLLIEEPEPVEQPWLPALLNDQTTESGFDVMDFLDGILQEGSPTDNDQGMTEIESSRPSTPGRIVGGTPGDSTPTPVLQNPWASESRAAAYGISFDDEEGNSGRLSNTAIGGNLGGNLPLLTPAAILNAEENNNGVGDEEEKAITFYTGLLDE